MNYLCISSVSRLYDDSVYLSIKCVYYKKYEYGNMRQKIVPKTMTFFNCSVNKLHTF